MALSLLYALEWVIKGNSFRRLGYFNCGDHDRLAPCNICQYDLLAPSPYLFQD